MHTMTQEPNPCPWSACDKAVQEHPADEMLKHLRYAEEEIRAKVDDPDV